MQYDYLYYFLIFIAATIDVKKYIYDLCVNSCDSQIALVENHGMHHSIQESVVRIYDVGRRKDVEDDQVHNFKTFWNIFIIDFINILGRR